MPEGEWSGKRPSVFVSYARADDEPFVERLHGDLKKAGFRVWWDRQAMESRGRTFLQEIRDAIEEVDRVIAVIGPEAITSDYVRYEWEYASLFAKEILPILRRGDYGLIPKEILPEVGYGLAEDAPNWRHAEDFRDDGRYAQALGRLIEILEEPVPDLGPLDGTPSLPPHFLPRRDDIKRLRDTVLADVQRPTVIISAKQTTALQGMGGIGKSVLAAAFARTIKTRRAFANGIIWLTEGQEATKLDLLNNIKRVGLFFEDDIPHDVDEMSARDRLQRLLADKVSLIILDDVWFPEQVEPFFNALGTRCRLLITTRDGGLVTDLGAQEHRVDALGDEEALVLLADWSQHERETLPVDARSVAEECGNLPFALALSGAMVRDGIPWSDVSDALKDADLSFVERTLPNYPYANVLRALKVSVDMLGRENPEAVRLYHELAVFRTDIPVPEDAVLTLWRRDRTMKERDARKLLTQLDRKALLRLNLTFPDRTISFHDL